MSAVTPGGGVSPPKAKEAVFDSPEPAKKSLILYGLVLLTDVTVNITLELPPPDDDGDVLAQAPLGLMAVFWLQAQGHLLAR